MKCEIALLKTDLSLRFFFQFKTTFNSIIELEADKHQIPKAYDLMPFKILLYSLTYHTHKNSFILFNEYSFSFQKTLPFVSGI